MALRPNLLPDSEYMLAPFDSRFTLRRKAFYFAELLLLVAEFWDIYDSHDLEYTFKSVCHSLALSIICLQVLIYDWKEREFSDLKLKVESMWKDHVSTGHGSHALYKKASKDCKIILSVFLSPFLSILVIYAAGILEYMIYFFNHGRVPNPEELTQFMFISIPFIDLDVSPYYEIALVNSLFIITVIIWKFAALNGFILGLVCHIIALHYSIIRKLEEINSSRIGNLRLLKSCMEKQEKLLRVVNQLQECLQFFLFSVFVFSAIILGLSLFEMTMELTNHSLAFNGLAIAIFMVSMMFLYSWMSQKLIDAANDLSFAYYNTPWYSESLKFGKMVLSAMQNLEKPMGLSVIYYQLNNELFGQLFSKAVSYFTIFSTLAKKNN